MHAFEWEEFEMILINGCAISGSNNSFGLGTKFPCGIFERTIIFGFLQ